MSTFSRNPHPSDDNISGTVCSLLLSDGDTEVKLANLTELIEVQPISFSVGGKQKGRKCDICRTLFIICVQFTVMVLWASQSDIENGEIELLHEQPGKKVELLFGRRKQGVTPCLSELLVHKKVHPSQINSGLSCDRKTRGGVKTW